MTAEYRVAILVVSTSVYQGTTADRAVEHLVGFLRTAGRATWRVIATDVVADDVGQIQRAVTRWTQPAAPRDLHNPDNYFQASADPTIDLLLTSGGTGLSPDDVTPEAVEPLLTRICPGFTAAMLTHSLGITPLATLSRPVCGVRCRTLVLTLPGKPKAAVENLEAVLPSLPHALDLIRGQASSRELHQRMNPAGGAEQHSGAKPQLPPRPTGHGHGHGHRCVHADHPTVVDPSATSHVHHRVAVAHRHRESQFPMVSVAEAGRLILNQLSTDLGTETLAVTPALAGRVLAQDVVAPVSVPAFRASMVDGYAVRAADGPGIYQVGPASVAGSLAQDVPALTDSAVQGGAQGATAASSTLTAVRVSTGAPVPDGADAVVMVEYTELNAMAADDQEEASIIISGTVQSGENIRAVGSDIQQGQVVLHTGDRLGLAGAELGALVSLGVRQVEVYRRPIVGVFSTGSELVDGPGSAEGATAGGETPLPAGRIYDSNRPALLAALRGHNFPVVDLGIVRDDADTVREFLLKTLKQDATGSRVDVLVSSGGVSMGEKDVLKSVLEHEVGARIHFGRVNMKPGKPTVFATIDRPAHPTAAPLLVFALPGNPVSAIVTAHLYVLPTLRRMAHEPAPELPCLTAKLQHDLPLDRRPEYHRGVVMTYFDAGGSTAPYHPAPVVAWSATEHQRSSRLLSFANSNALLILPAREPHRPVLEAGSEISVLLIDRLLNYYGV